MVHVLSANPFAALGPDDAAAVLNPYPIASTEKNTSDKPKPRPIAEGKEIKKREVLSSEKERENTDSSQSAQQWNTQDRRSQDRRNTQDRAAPNTGRDSAPGVGDRPDDNRQHFSRSERSRGGGRGGFESRSRETYRERPARGRGRGRQFDRQSGSGRRDNIKREGQGQYNWGTEGDEQAENVVSDNSDEIRKQAASSGDTGFEVAPPPATHDGQQTTDQDTNKKDTTDDDKDNQNADGETSENKPQGEEKQSEPEVDYDAYMKQLEDNAVVSNVGAPRKTDGSKFDKERGGTHLFARNDNSNDYFFVSEQRNKKPQKKTRKGKPVPPPELFGSVPRRGFRGRGVPRGGGGRGRSFGGRGNRARGGGRGRGGRGASFGNWNDSSFDQQEDSEAAPSIADQQLFPSLA